MSLSFPFFLFFFNGRIIRKLDAFAMIINKTIGVFAYVTFICTVPSVVQRLAYTKRNSCKHN